MDGEMISQEALKQWGDLLGLNLGQDRLERLVPRLGGFFQNMKVLEEIEVGDEEPTFILPEEQG